MPEEPPKVRPAQNDDESLSSDDEEEVLAEEGFVALRECHFSFFCFLKKYISCCPYHTYI